jgi:hypothetical protein
MQTLAERFRHKTDRTRVSYNDFLSFVGSRTRR